jgi:hypothetical protein
MWVGILQAIDTSLRRPTRKRNAIPHSVLVGIDAKVPSEFCYSTFLDRQLPKPTHFVEKCRVLRGRSELSV